MHRNFDDLEQLMMTIEDINTIRLALATPEHNRHYEKHAADAHEILNKAEDITRSNQNLGDIGDVRTSLLVQLGDSYADVVKGKTIPQMNLIDFGITQELGTILASKRILEGIRQKNES